MYNELFVITSYYNPCGWVTRRKNYDLFIAGLDKLGVNHLTIECTFGEHQKYNLSKTLKILQCNSDTLVWQKERLLNIAASTLPASCKYVAWIDCDLIFENDNWPEELINVLQKNKIAQLFTEVVKLNKLGRDTGYPEDFAISYAAKMQYSKELLSVERYDAHGHTGYAWAMHRSIFDELGLYEHAISGSADHFMAHAIFDNYNFCITNALKKDEKQISHLKYWGKKFYELTEGKLGVVHGKIKHLWHGDTKDRRYFKRMHDITDLGYNPWTDLKIVPGMPIQWADGFKNDKLKQYFVDYFLSRKED